MAPDLLKDWRHQPRGPDGRWIGGPTHEHHPHHEALSAADRDTARSVVAAAKPLKFTSDRDATTYLTSRKPKLTAAQRGALDRYTGDGFLGTNRRLRGGDTDHPDIRHLDAAMKPTSDDLMVTRHVNPDAFGLTHQNAARVAGLAGKVIADQAYSSTALGSPYRGGLGGVTMHILLPKGTPAIMAAAFSNNPAEREVLLGRGQRLAVARVEKNHRGGYDLYAIALPHHEAEAA